MHKKGASLYFGGFKTIWKTELKKLSDAVCLADECLQSKPAGMNCPASQGDEPRRGGGVSAAGFRARAQGHKRGIPRGTIVWLTGGFTWKMGGDLLSRLSRQYHRRGRA